MMQTSVNKIHIYITTYKTRLWDGLDVVDMVCNHLKNKVSHKVLTSLIQFPLNRVPMVEKDSRSLKTLSRLDERLVCKICSLLY